MQSPTATLCRRPSHRLEQIDQDVDAQVAPRAKAVAAVADAVVADEARLRPPQRGRALVRRKGARPRVDSLVERDVGVREEDGAARRERPPYVETGVSRELKRAVGERAGQYEGLGLPVSRSPCRSVALSVAPAEASDLKLLGLVPVHGTLL